MIYLVAAVIFAFNIIVSAGCSDNSVTGPYIDTGSYTLQATPSSIRSYRGGGGIFLLSMIPSEEFGGQVLLSISADSNIHVQISPEVLTLGKQTAEVTIRPDATVALGMYNIIVITTHDGASQTFNLETEIVTGDPLWSRDYAISKQDEFVTWLQAECPKLGIEMGQDWFGYNNTPILEPGTPGNWTFLNDSWDMNIYWVAGPTSPVWFSLRPRGEVEAILAAKKELGVPIHEIPVSEFGK